MARFYGPKDALALQTQGIPLERSESVTQRPEMRYLVILAPTREALEDERRHHKAVQDRLNALFPLVSHDCATH